MKRKIKAALEAIETVFCDTTVSQQKTLDALEEIRDEVEFKIGAIKSDLRMGNG